jgi:hypothetical protein
LEAFEEDGEAVVQVEGVADQPGPGGRGQVEGGGEGFVGEGCDGGGAVPAQRVGFLQQGEDGAVGALGAGLGGGGVQDRPVVGQAEAE